MKYSDTRVSDIAFEVGFEERTSFNKAFKKRYGCSPSAFRTSSESVRKTVQQSILQEEGADRKRLQFQIEYLPDFEFIFLEYLGDYEDISAIEEVGNQLYSYALDKKILNNNSIFLTEIMDDSEISDSIHLRYNLGFTLAHPLSFEPEGFFRTKKHKRQKYAKFTYKGSYQQSFDFYNKIYAFWMLDVGLELEDLPTLEYYPNFDIDRLPEEILMKVYIPIK